MILNNFFSALILFYQFGEDFGSPEDTAREKAEALGAAQNTLNQMMKVDPSNDLFGRVYVEKFQALVEKGESFLPQMGVFYEPANYYHM